MCSSDLPGGSTNIYEFLHQYELYASEHLTRSATGPNLYHKHLDPSLVAYYPEISSLQADYPRLKEWLILKFGDPKVIADNALKVISEINTSSLGENASNLMQCRTIYNTLLNLTQLQVPKLTECLASNTFMVALVEILPEKVKQKFLNEQADNKVTSMSNIEGVGCLNLALELLWKYIGRYNLTIAQDSHNAPQPDQSTHTNPCQQHSNSHSTSSTHLGNLKTMHSLTCPLSGHHGHLVSECTEFFSTSPGRRRFLMRGVACYTCLGRNSHCRNGFCNNQSHVPAELICTTCSQNVALGKSPPLSLLCGLPGHPKPPKGTC